MSKRPDRSSKHIWIADACTSAEWEAIRARLEELSLDQMKTLAERLGNRFVHSEEALTKEDFLNIIDENYLDELEGELAKIRGQQDKNPDRAT